MASGLMVESPVMKIRETGTDAAKTVKPMTTASFWGMLAERMTTIITDMMRKARGQGWGISSDRMRVRAKMETMMLRHPRTNRRMKA